MWGQKYIIYLLFLFLLVLSDESKAIDPPGQNTARFHSSIMRTQTEENGIEKISLNGTWKFKLFKEQDIGDKIFKIDYNAASWSLVSLPSNLQAEKRIDLVYLQKGTQPQKKNLVACYKTIFDLPDDWDLKEEYFFLKIAHATGLCQVWLNGSLVGYDQNPNGTTEYNVAKYLKSEKNLLTIKQQQDADINKLTTNEGFNYQGIFGDIELERRPMLFVQDINITAEFDTLAHHGKLVTKVLLTKSDNFKIKKQKLKLSVLDEDKLLYEQEVPIVEGVFEYVFRRDLKKIIPWSAENPQLYTVEVALKNKRKEVLETCHQKIGFKSLTIKNNNILLNGRAIKINGINWISHDASRGNSLDEETMGKDIQLLKQFNINAVRLSAPAPDYFYDLCDQHGIYVFNSANIQPIANILANNLEWYPLMLNQVQSMYERTKNHCSIISWAVNNEPIVGENFDKCFTYLGAKDKSRLLLYEGSTLSQYCLSTSSKTQLQQEMNKTAKPFLHKSCISMAGNGAAGLSNYWEYVKKNEQLQGGFISSFVDLAFIQSDADNNEYWAFGDDLPNIKTKDTISYVDGMFTADRHPHPHAYEVQKVFQPLQISLKDTLENVFSIKNNYVFTALTDCKLRYKIMRNATIIKEDNVIISHLLPNASTDFKIAHPNTLEGNIPYFIYFDVENEKYERIAWDQFLLPTTKSESTAPVNKARFKEKTTDTTVHLIRGDFEFKIHKKTGKMLSIKLNGKEYLKAGFEPVFWRPLLDGELNDTNKTQGRLLKEVTKNLKMIEFTTSYMSNNDIAFEFYYILADLKTKLRLTYLVSKDPKIKVSYRLMVDKDVVQKVAKIGMKALLSYEYDQAIWQGEGPLDNYSNKNEYATQGVYRMPVNNLYYPYLRSQDSGTRTGISWMALYSQYGSGIMVKGNNLSINTLHFDAEKLDALTYKNKHGNMVNIQDFIWWSIDWQQAGIPDHNQWSEPDIFLKNCSYEFTLYPFVAGTDIVEFSETAN